MSVSFARHLDDRFILASGIDTIYLSMWILFIREPYPLQSESSWVRTLCFMINQGGELLPQNSRFSPLSNSMSGNHPSAIPAIFFSVLSLAILSMIYEGWLFGGVSFQQTTVGGPVWYITQRLVDLIYPSTWFPFWQTGIITYATDTGATHSLVNTETIAPPFDDLG